jgi:hypothetical protein
MQEHGAVQRETIPLKNRGRVGGTYPIVPEKPIIIFLTWGPLRSKLNQYKNKFVWSRFKS